jgi:hypothetical protein
MVEACLEAMSMIMRKHYSGQLRVEPMVICRSMVVLGFAPFVPQGRLLVMELASILQRDASQPAELMRGYAEAVVDDDTLIIREVDGCIARYSQWREWSAIWVEWAVNLPYTPRPIGVAPPISAEIVGVLAEMIKEREDDESGRDYPGYPAS